MTTEEIIKQLETILAYYKVLKITKPQFLDIEENKKDIEAITCAIECVKEKFKG